MTKTIVVLVWLTLVIVGLVVYIPIIRDNHIKKMSSACNTRVHNLFASANANVQDAYGVLPYKDAWTLENDAKKDCVVQYPLN